MSDQERISLYNMNTIKQKSDGNKEKILIRGLLVIQYQKRKITHEFLGAKGTR